MFCQMITFRTIFLTRNSKDKTINLNGRKLLDFCRQNELRICNGRLGDDRNIGNFTFTGSTGKSVVDYVITNPTMFESFMKFNVCDPNILSDHCLIEFSIYRNKNIYTAQSEEMEHGERLHKKYIWTDIKKDQYISNLNGVENELSGLTDNLMQTREPENIDRNINSFLKIMENVCDPLFAVKINVPTENSDDLKYTDRKNKPWFDEDCQNLRNMFYRKLNKYSG